jgi:hypothetical protein
MAPNYPNPYAAPQSDFAPSVVARYEPTGSVWRDGGLLVFRKGARLDDRCVKCNATGDGKFLRRRLSWHPEWIYFLVFLGLLVYVIVALVVRQTATLDIGLCARHRSLRNRRILAAWSMFIASMLAIMAAIAIQSETLSPVIGVVGFVGMLAAPIYGAVAARMIVPKRIDAYFAWVKGVCPEYLDRLPPLS